MEQSCLGKDETDFNLKEWGLKAKISRANTSSRRFSESNLRSFRGSNIIISSTVSSPGYTLKGEIVPSTYSFTTALKALQAKTVYAWEHVSPDGYSLNSKWNDAEKYICNPLSGQVPMECLSAKTLSGRSFRVANRISMPHINAKVTSQVKTLMSCCREMYRAQEMAKWTIELRNLVRKDNVLKKGLRFSFICCSIAVEKRRNSTRDVGTQSTSVNLSSSSPSPAPTPSIEERSIKTSEADSSISSEIEVKETREKKYTKRNGGERKEQMKCGCRYTQWGCLGVWRMTTTVRQQNKHNPRIKINKITS